jgi:hypothetical protein
VIWPSTFPHLRLPRYGDFTPQVRAIFVPGIFQKVYLQNFMALKRLSISLTVKHSFL